MHLRRFTLTASILLISTLFTTSIAQSAELQTLIDTWQREHEILGISVSLESPVKGRVDLVSGNVI
ncbi:MAG: hypothetical protein AAF267_20210, partial [Deinococcota bacterium]